MKARCHDTIHLNKWKGKNNEHLLLFFIMLKIVWTLHLTLFWPVHERELHVRYISWTWHELPYMYMDPLLTPCHMDYNSFYVKCTKTHISQHCITRIFHLQFFSISALQRRISSKHKKHPMNQQKLYFVAE